MSTPSNGINYRKEESYDQEALDRLQYHYVEILRLIGEDPGREGLLNTPERVAKAMGFLTQRSHQDPAEIILSSRFNEEYMQMVIVKDIKL